MKLDPNYKDKDIFSLIEEYPVHLSGCDEELEAKLRKEWDIDDDDECIWMLKQDIEDYDVPYDAVSWDFGQRLDEYESEFIKQANHYLVFARECRWNGASGYKLCKTFDEALYRDYDHTMYIQAVSRGGKAISFRECSHDVPTGNTTVVIALTDKEYERLQEASFSQVEDFATRLTPKA